MSDQMSYHEKADALRIEKIRELLKELPLVCGDYFRSIAQTTSTLTRLAYAYDLRLFFQFLCREQAKFSACSPETFTAEALNEITARDIDYFQDYLTLYNRAVETEDTVYMQNHEPGIMRKLCCIRSFCEYLFKTEIIKANVATLVSLPKLHEKPILYLELDEINKLIKAVETGEGLSDRQQKYQRFTRSRDLAMLLLFLGTGIRVSECVGIDIQDIDLDNRAFIVTRKGGDQTILYYPDQVADALNDYLSERKAVSPIPGHENALFLSIQKRRITQRAVENLVKKYAAIAAPLKQRMSPHKLRSTFGTHLYEETGDIYLVADVLGHADVNTTRKHYAAMSDEHKREAARRVRLPRPSAADPHEEIPVKDNN